MTGPAVTMLKGAWISSWIGYADVALSSDRHAGLSRGRAYTRPAPRSSRSIGRRRDRAYQEPRAYRHPARFARWPTGRADVVDQQVDIWTYDASGHVLNRVTDSPSWDAYPIWDPLMRWLAFSSTRDGVAAIYRQDVRMQHRRKNWLRRRRRPIRLRGPVICSPSRRRIRDTGLDCVGLLVRVEDEQRVLAHAVQRVESAEFSPDGRFIAYESTEAGVADGDLTCDPIPQVNPRRQGVQQRRRPVTAAGDRAATELYYRVGGQGHGRADEAHAGRAVGRPREVCRPAGYGGYDALAGWPGASSGAGDVTGRSRPLGSTS